MSLFQEYETKRKPFNVGKRWICVDAESIGFPSKAQGEIIEITENKESICRYKVLRGSYEALKYTTEKRRIAKAYEPYNGPI